MYTGYGFKTFGSISNIHIEMGLYIRRYLVIIKKHYLS